MPHNFENDELLGAESLKTDVYDTDILVFQPEVLARELARCGATYRSSNYRIGIWSWELENFPPEWMPALDLLDEVWVPSDFIAAALRKVTSRPVRRMSHAVELTPRRR